MTHVLLTYPGLIPSVLLCGQYQFTELARQGKIEFRSIARTALTAEDCGWVDVVCMVRSDNELDVALAKRWKQAEKKLVYVMDDDLLHVPETLSSGPYYAQKYVQASIRTMIELCDVFLSPSEVLRNTYGKGKSAVIEEPCSQYHPKQHKNNDVVRIGFAGSLDRGGDLDTLLGGVLESLLDKYGDYISLEFFGAHPHLADARHLKCIPYCEDYDTYRKTIETLDWDIGLAPMPETPFHACKHYNKWIEYAGLGIAGIYSDVVPYTRIVHSEENGLLCANTPEAWTAAISRLIEDRPLRARISQNAQQQAQTAFSVEVTSRLLERELGGMLAYSAPDYAPIRIPRRVYIKTQFRRGWSALRRYGLRLPTVAAQRLPQKK
jgi:hypothetical protein